MFKKYSLLISVLACSAGQAQTAACGAACETPAANPVVQDAVRTSTPKTAETEASCDACTTCRNCPGASAEDSVLPPCKSQIDLESMFPVESWKKFCQSLSAEEQNDLKRMTEDVNCCFNKLSEELGGTLKVHKQLMDKYKKHKGITTCCYSLAFNLVPQEETMPVASKDAAAVSDAANPEFAKSLSQEEQTEFDGLQAKLQEIGRRTSAQVVEIFESNKPLKTKLLDFCKSTKHTLLLTMSCDHPELSETIKIVN